MLTELEEEWINIARASAKINKKVLNRSHRAEEYNN